MGFLKDFGSKWNISLFHYRNLGAAFAKVLIGIQDTNINGKKLEKHLKISDYSFIEETSNNAYQDFLR
jgi:threonine dehydratase